MTHLEFDRALQVYIKLFDKHKIRWWLDYGTLLGFIRDKSVMLWDRDIDFSMMYTSKVDALLEDIHDNEDIKVNKVTAFKKNWMQEYVGEKACSKVNKASTNIGDTRIGLHFNHCGINKYEDYVYYMNRKDALIQTPIHFYAVLNQVRYDNYVLNIPKQSIKYLEYVYGSTWKAPIPSDTYFDSQIYKDNQKRWLIKR